MFTAALLDDNAYFPIYFYCVLFLRYMCVTMNVYIEASFTIKSTGEHKTIEVKINEDLIPFGVAKFLTRRYGEISGLCFNFTREAED